MIDGMQMDAETAIVAPDLATLDLYCDRVAAAVGRLSVRAFGDASPAADRVAYSLGRALQLTNILRDLTEDADRGRLYLPREWLDEAGVPQDPRAALIAPGLPDVCNRVAALAHEHFRAAHTAMRQCDAKAMRPARLMGATYAAHPVAAGAARLVAPRPARQSAGLAEAMAGVSPRRGVAPHALEQCTYDVPMAPWGPHGTRPGRGGDAVTNVRRHARLRDHDTSRRLAPGPCRMTDR